MSRFFPLIYLPLGFLVVFGGCRAVEPPPQEPSIEVARPAESVSIERPGEQTVAEASRVAATGSPGTPEEPPDSNNIAAESTATGPQTTDLSAEQANSEVSEPDIPTPAVPAPEARPRAIAAVPTESKTEPPAASEDAAEPASPTLDEKKEQEEQASAVSAEPTQVDHKQTDVLASFYAGYAEILQEYVQEDGRVDYSPLRRRRLQLKQLLSDPDELDPNVYQGWAEEERLAFWINTYNLKMLDVIARNYPIQSSWWLRLTWPPSDIRHIGGIWSDYRFIVMDEEFTLGEVERRFFHKTFGDPRAYLAISYAARSGPALRRTPYRGSQLNQQLDEQVRAFLASDQGFRIDRDKKVVYLSAIFKPSWRGKEFVGRYGTQKKFKNQPAETRAVLNFLTHYISQDDVYFLEVENYTLAYMNFDWRLNDQGRGY